MEKSMQRHPSRHIARAFTLIELLTVIAIIAVLAAILFPIFGTVREQTRQSASLSKMHSMYVGARLFYEDEGRFPPSLYGYAEVPLANPNAAGPFARPAMPTDAASSITPMNYATGSYNTSTGLIRGYLFGEQVKDYVTFLNDDNIGHTTSQVTEVYWPTILTGGTPVKVTWINPTYAGMLSNGCPITADIDFPCSDNDTNPCSAYDSGAQTNAYTGPGVPKLYYIEDSMDIGPMLNGNGEQMKDSSGALMYELHYSPDWTHQLYDPTLGCDTYTDASSVVHPYVTQLKYKNPPSENTIISWVTQHVATSGSPNTLILLASGTARKINYQDAMKELPLGYK
jgi:prepilin-type N-terminal cleavage/methylation domain-containing protein